MSEMENVSQTNKNKENPHTDGQLSDVPAYSTDEKIPPPPQPQPQPLGVPQATSVATCKQQQPSTARRHTRRPAVPHSANTTYILSICWCVVCCLCGSPLTLACFIPAIYLSSTAVRYYGVGDYDSGNRTLRCARIFLYIGIFTGVVAVIAFVVLRTLPSGENDN